MKFQPTELSDVVLVETEVHHDFRGDFYRAWCSRDFSDSGLTGPMVQASVSVTAVRNTVRGLHFQAPPSQEGKLVRCIAGAIFDVAVDVRPDSPTFGRHISVRLEGHDGRALFIPSGFAHGFQTLTDNTQILYMMTDYFEPALAMGIRWDDPELGIAWPLADPKINDRDRTYPTLEEFRNSLDSSALDQRS